MIITDRLPELQRLKKPPEILHFRGNMDLLNSRKIAIVGSRKMSNYSKMLILRLASELTKRQICVVSGAALGCDITAHIGAMPHTIAVFGNGLNQIYPKNNEKIIQEIYRNALALSEYDDDMMPQKWSFLERNRIVVGLSEALIIAQADVKSGSLASAKIALEIGVPIYVLPHRMGESDGTNALLAQNKATLIDDIDKFVAKFGEISKPKDEILEFIAKNGNYDEIFAKFGEKIFEYELEGKIEIVGTKVIIK